MAEDYAATDSRTAEVHAAASSQKAEDATAASNQRAEDPVTADRQKVALNILHTHMGWSTGAGLIPVPLADLAAITAVQLHLLRSLARLYGVAYQKNAAKLVIGGLVTGGGTYLAAGPISSLVKLIPVVGQVTGAVVLPAVAVASTYALGKVFIQHFESGGTFLNLDPDAVRRHYHREYESMHGATH